MKENPYKTPEHADEPPSAAVSADDIGGGKALGAGLGLGLLLGVCVGGLTGALLGVVTAACFPMLWSAQGEPQFLALGMLVGVRGAVIGCGAGLVIGLLVGLIAMNTRRTFRLWLQVIAATANGVFGLAFAVFIVLLMPAPQGHLGAHVLSVAGPLVGATGGALGGWILGSSVAHVAWPPLRTTAGSNSMENGDLAESQ